LQFKNALLYFLQPLTTMKFILLILLGVTTSLGITYAQSNSWFKGTWYGERTFPDSRIAAKALMRMEIDAVKGKAFTGRLIYMYPSDTTARLIRKIDGELYSKAVIITRSEEIYRLDPRSRSFWSDCARCPGVASYFIQNDSLILQITSSACGDSCNGETIFRRKMQDYSTGMQAAIVKNLVAKTALVQLASYTMPALDTTGNPSGTHKDSLKYFPTLLGDRMSFHFDPDKYANPRAQSADTVSSAKQKPLLNKMSKRNEIVKKPARDSTTAIKSINGNAGNIPASKGAIKDSIALSKKKSNNTIAVRKLVQDSIARKVQAKDAATKSNNISSVIVAAPQGEPKDALTAPPAPVKDTVPTAIIQRTTSLVTTYQVNSPHISVQLFDDGQIDGDAVSVYYNGKVIINNKTLTHKAITFTMDATAVNKHHEFILISESEGFLQPNTALMRIKAGSQQFELKVSSSSSSNAKIAIDYTGE
jgi:hypothetical protein